MLIGQVEGDLNLDSGIYVRATVLFLFLFPQ